MNRYGFEPDFENLRTVLLGGCGQRVPNAELVIDREIKEAFLGRPVESTADEIEFRYQAGYDYVWISVGMIDPAGTVNKERVCEKDLESYPWPDPDKLDLTPFREAEVHLKKGMKAIAVLGKIFTAAWQLVGFERFCELVYVEPRFIDALMERIGSVQVAVFRRLARLDAVGAFWIPDGIAFHSGPLLAPQWLRERLFPFYNRMCVLGRELGKPVIYHSDGDLNSVLDDILDAGFHALHPIEPESMDIYDLRRRIGRNLCLVGNICVDTLSRGSPREIRDLVKDRILRLGREGAYCVGSSNSVPRYVPLDNYRALLEASAEFAKNP